MEEIWKDIKGYEGLYQVSNLGNVKSLDRTIPQRKYGKKIERRVKGKELKLWLAKSYYHVTLSKEHNIKAPFVHKLVAEAFVDNPKNYKCVNHIDENKSNNKAENLEWCTYKYNRNYGTGEQRRVEAFMKSVKDHKRKRKAVIQFDKEGNLIRKYYSMTECTKYGFNTPGICNCCSGKRKTYRGYVWRYSEE